MLSWIATTQAAVQAAPANIAPQVLEAVAGGGGERGLLAPGRLAAQGGQNGRGQGHAKDAQGKLDQPVGVVEVGDRAGLQQRGEEDVSMESQSKIS